MKTANFVGHCKTALKSLTKYLIVAVENQWFGLEWIRARFPPQMDGINLRRLTTELISPTLKVQQLIGDVLKRNISYNMRHFFSELKYPFNQIIYIAHTLICLPITSASCVSTRVRILSLFIKWRKRPRSSSRNWVSWKNWNRCWMSQSLFINKQPSFFRPSNFHL